MKNSLSFSLLDKGIRPSGDWFCGTASATIVLFQSLKRANGRTVLHGAVFHVDGLLAQGLRVAAMRPPAEGDCGSVNR